MARPWRTLARADTRDGTLELRERNPGEFLVTVAGRVLMNSAASRSETELGRLAAEAVRDRTAPRVLVGGLGMGCTLRAALDALPADAEVTVCELHEEVVRWCRGPLAALTEAALADPRVRVRMGDVADAVADAARPGAPRYDAVVLDLYEGPAPGVLPRAHPHYGRAALDRTRRALRTGGVLAVWSEDPSPAFERSLRRTGFALERLRPGRAGRRHAVYLATRDGDPVGP